MDLSLSRLLSRLPEESGRVVSVEFEMVDLLKVLTSMSLAVESVLQSLPELMLDWLL